MTIQKEIDGNKLTFIISGEMDTPAAALFKKEYRDTMSESPGITELVLDFTELDFIVSSGLRVLLEMARDMNGKGTISTVGVNDRVMETINMTGIAQYLNII
ncbi:MAG: STAS domain-containing protein [Lachnospiraceae bacterium]|nr:STAS domain-containing protein [Lachnospiraceae bacterium]